eukprot:4043164-Pleurochrysis_carterae.AAC.3
MAPRMRWRWPEALFWLSQRRQFGWTKRPRQAQKQEGLRPGSRDLVPGKRAPWWTSWRRS